ncbi:MAG: hypothetical protein PVG03_05430 [Desulfarculaceae bacterium]|jgi:hypothetical protein
MDTLTLLPLQVLDASWDLLLDASIYVLLGILIAGVAKVYLSPSAVANHLGRGRFAPVFKAALFGIPLPL